VEKSQPARCARPEQAAVQDEHQRGDAEPASSTLRGLSRSGTRWTTSTKTHNEMQVMGSQNGEQTKVLPHF
jgi:hypothetical protein